MLPLPDPISIHISLNKDALMLNCSGIQLLRREILLTDLIALAKNSKEGFKIAVSEIGNLYLKWNGSVELRANGKILDQLKITAPCRVTVENVRAMRLEIESRSVWMSGKNQIKTLKYTFIHSQINQKHLRQIDPGNMYTQLQQFSFQSSKFRLLDLSTLQVTDTHIHGDFIFGKNSQILLNRECMMRVSQQLIIRSGCKLWADGSVGFFARKLENRGQISSRNGKDGAILIKAEYLDNYGRIDAPQLQIVSRQILNQNDSRISSMVGKIMADQGFQNRGFVRIPQLSLGESISSAQRIFENHKDIFVRNLKLNCSCFVNLGNIISEKVEIEGKPSSDNNLFKNKGLIYVNLHFICNYFRMVADPKSRIAATNPFALAINGWLSSGETVISGKAKLTIKAASLTKGVYEYDIQNITELIIKCEASNKTITKEEDVFIQAGSISYVNNEFYNSTLSKMLGSQITNNQAQKIKIKYKTQEIETSSIENQEQTDFHR